MNKANFSELLGNTIVKIEGLEEGSEEVRIWCDDGSAYTMLHEQDCCESVRVVDVAGVADDLLDTPITMAEEVSERGASPNDGSSTWTFYKLATVKGYVTIRWLGESNGYYSESVSFLKTED